MHGRVTYCLRGQKKPIAHTTEIKRSDFPVKRTISRTSLFSIKVLVIWRVFFLGGGSALRAHLRGGVAKCVLYACIGGEGVKKGQKTACALYGRPLKGLEYRSNKLVALYNLNAIYMLYILQPYIVFNHTYVKS